MAWLSGYTYRKQHTINGAAGAGTNYQQKIKAYYDKRPVGSFTYVSTTGSDVYSCQGIATDGTYFYTTAGDDNKHLYKFNSSWVLQSSHDCSADWPAGCTQVNHIFCKDGKLYLGACDYPDATPEGWIMVYNASDLSYDTVHSVGAIECEGCAFYDGYWWVIRGDSGQIQKWNTSWVHQTDYNITHVSGGNSLFCPGYQGIMWKDDFIYVTVHKDCTPEERCDVYYFDGTNFTLVKRITPPTIYCSQGLCLDPDGETVWWAERDHGGVANDDRVVKTTIAFDNEEVGLGKNSKTDFGDLRITKSDGSTIYAGNSNGWREHKIGSVFAAIWWKMPDDLGTAKNVYLYYANNAASWTDGGISDVMDHVNDFETGTVQDFTNAYNGGSVEASTTEKYEGSYAIKTLLAGKGVYSGDKTFWSTAKKAIDIWMLSTANNVEATICWVVSGDNIKRVIISVESDGVEYTDSAGNQKLIKGDFTGMWIKYALKLNADNTTFDIYAYNDKLALLGSATGKSFSEVSRTYRDILLYDAINYCDLIFSHKYTVPEPTQGSWGTEEGLLAGSITATSSVTGSLSVSREIVGSVSGGSSVTGTLSRHRPLAGPITTVASVSGAILKFIPLAGSIITSSSVVGTSKVAWSLKGAVPAAAASLSGTLGVAWSLKGDTSAISLMEATASVAWSLKGSIAAASSVSGAIIESTYLAGSISAVSAPRLHIMRRWACSMCSQVRLFHIDYASLSVITLMSGTVSATSSLQGILSHRAPERGFYYAKLDTTILTGIEKPSFRITEEIDKIPSFEIDVANCSDNRTTIAAGITDVLTIYRRKHDVDTLMFTGIINADTIEYLSLERIRLTGYASYIDLNWRFHQHLNSEDAETADKVFNYFSPLEDFTTFTEVDIGADRIQKTTNHVDHYACRGEETYLYKDYGAGHFGDFTHKIKFRAETLPAMNYAPFWVLADAVDSSTGLFQKSIMLYPFGTDLYLREWHNTNNYDDVMTNMVANTWYYIKLEKSGTSFTAKIYSDSDYTVLIDTLVLTLQANHTFRYLYACNTIDSDSGYCANHDIENFNLTGSGEYTDYTTAANNDTINDVSVTFGSINDALYIGQGETFFGMQVKYSTKGAQAANTTVVFEYSKGSGVWATLDVLDETRAFTEDAGTYFITIPHKPSDWAKDTVNSVKKFWIRARLSVGSYTTSPALDRIKLTNTDVYRVYYFETSANSIMTDVLAGTGYSMDATDVCPSDTISVVAEYETKLRFIAGVANALTWDDGGDKKAYQWWIDTSKKVHFKQKRGATLGDITSELTILNNVEDYFNLSNRLHVLGNYDGLSQLRAVIEDTSSQDTHEIRELAVPEERYNNYIPLKEAAQKAMTYTKAPLQKIAATVTTKYWLDYGFEVGDTVTLHNDTWNVDSTAFQIVRADIGPRVTKVDMGISQEHLDGLKAGLQRQLDISGIRMHGSTTLLQFGPETMNYQRINDSTVYPARLKIEIPSDVRYIHKVLLSWTIGPYRASVEPDTSPTNGHDHTGYTGSGGAFTPDVLDGGAHTPTELGEGDHDHTVTIARNYSYTSGYLPKSKYVSYESSHTHPKGSTGGPDDTADAITYINFGSACASGACVTGGGGDTFALDTHWHLNTGLSTGSGTSHRHTISVEAADPRTYLYDYYSWIDVVSTEPAHEHTINSVAAHPHTGVAEPAHSDHVVTTEPGKSVSVEYGIHEIAAGTTLELLVNSEVVSSDYVGNQTDISIGGYLSTGSNTVEIRPIVGENAKKGSCATLATGIVFIEAKKF